MKVVFKAMCPPRIVTGAFVIVMIIMLFMFSGCKKNIREISDVAPDARSKSLHMTPNLKGVDVALVADNFVSPLGVVAVPDNTKRLFVIDQVGKIWIIDSNGTKLTAPFFDVSLNRNLSDKEAGDCLLPISFLAFRIRQVFLS